MALHQKSDICVLQKKMRCGSSTDSEKSTYFWKINFTNTGKNAKYPMHESMNIFHFA